jgi:hypothetical protein
MPNDYFRESSEADYFIRDWLKSLVQNRVNYASGWQYDPNDPNYNYTLAYATGVSPKALQEGHWPTMTPKGNWLKESTHPTRWREYELQLLNALRGAGGR